MDFSEVYTFLAKGGPVMVPIVLFSVVVLGVFLERVTFLRRERLVPRRLVEKLVELTEEGRIAEAMTLAQSQESSAARVAEAGLRYVGRSRGVILQVLEEAGRRETVYLERYTGILSASATVTPLLGLLGTVTGMIAVFQTVVIHGANGGQVDAALLAGGIWEAMLTTAAGLTVAIPAFLGHRYLISRVDSIIEDLSLFGEQLLENLSPSEERPQAICTINYRDSEGGRDVAAEGREEGTKDRIKGSAPDREGKKGMKEKEGEKGSMEGEGEEGEEKGRNEV